MVDLHWVLLELDPAKSKIDNVLTEHVGLLHVLPLAVHPEFFLLDKWGGPL